MILDLFNWFIHAPAWQLIVVAIVVIHIVGSFKRDY